MSVRLAIVGAGIMGADHARIFAERLPGAELRIVCDPDQTRAKRLADAVGAADVMIEAEAAIQRPDVDAVVIASPDFTHAPSSLACIRAGKPVLCEKPLSQSSKECLEVMEAEIAAGRRFVQLGFMRRFDQSYVEMKGARVDGKLGRPLMMHNFHRNVETPSADFTGAMAITSSAPHEFDVVRFVLATEYRSISAFQPRRSDAVVAPVIMVLETADDQLVTIEVNNNAAYGYDVRAELVGETGSISLNAPAFSKLDAGLTHSTGYAPDWRARFAEAYWRQNQAFLHFVRTGEFSPIAADCWDGYAAAVVGEAGVRALHAGRTAAVETAPTPRFYVRRKESMR
jgi:myo-inositol 2-dehydrogenase / D-chiro-inositol 1-dehydrogenase